MRGTSHHDVVHTLYRPVAARVLVRLSALRRQTIVLRQPTHLCQPKTAHPTPLLSRLPTPSLLVLVVGVFDEGKRKKPGIVNHLHFDQPRPLADPRPIPSM
ncbi:hypothetical protein LIA77_10613 [Sarocladium implicatum]|nr:hypothetical protein LIA77_10613 [Sarocladium implicatum]